METSGSWGGTTDTAGDETAPEIPWVAEDGTVDGEGVGNLLGGEWTPHRAGGEPSEEEVFGVTPPTQEERSVEPAPSTPVDDPHGAMQVLEAMIQAEEQGAAGVGGRGPPRVREAKYVGEMEGPGAPFTRLNLRQQATRECAHPECGQRCTGWVWRCRCCKEWLHNSECAMWHLCGEGCEDIKEAGVTEDGPRLPYLWRGGRGGRRRRNRKRKVPLDGVVRRGERGEESATEKALRPGHREAPEEAVLSGPTPALNFMGRDHEVSLADLGVDQLSTYVDLEVKAYVRGNQDSGGCVGSRALVVGAAGSGAPARHPAPGVQRVRRDGGRGALSTTRSSAGRGDKGDEGETLQ